MSEQDSLRFRPPKEKPKTPLEKINHGVFEIANVMELGEEDYESLRRYANLVYRINEITFDFNFDYIAERTYPLDSGEGVFTLTRDNYRQFRDLLKARVGNLRETVFDKDANLNHARSQVLVIVNDNIPKI